MTWQSLLGTSTELAEIPGLGKVLPSVARDLLAHAGLRRLVVDDGTGELLQVDDTSHRPPAPPVTDQSAVGKRRPTAQVEPPPYDDQVEHPTDLADLIWAHQHPPDEPPGPRPAPESRSTEDPCQQGVSGSTQAPSITVARVHEPVGPCDDTKTQLLTPTIVQAQTETPSWTPEALATALTRIATDPYEPRDLASSSYTPPRRLKRFLVTRDGTGVYPGCRRKAQHTDKDHLDPWPRGAPTAENLASECPHHHRAMHHHVTLTRLPSGGLRWRTPAGLAYDVPPRTLLR